MLNLKLTLLKSRSSGEKYFQFSFTVLFVCASTFEREKSGSQEKGKGMLILYFSFFLSLIFSFRARKDPELTGQRGNLSESALKTSFRLRHARLCQCVCFWAFNHVCASFLLMSGPAFVCSPLDVFAFFLHQGPKGNENGSMKEEACLKLQA